MTLLFGLNVLLHLVSYVSSVGKSKADLLEEPLSSEHILSNSSFWNHFQSKVLLKSWSCNFPESYLLDTLEKDSKLYSEDSIFRKRRLGVIPLIQNETLWTSILLGAAQEVAVGSSLGSVYSKQLEELNMLEAFTDYIEHLNFFYGVASKMSEKGQTVIALSQDSSSIHDIDKLDPVMLVAYSERFEDNTSTSVWDECVERHTHVNPHHQAHCLWHDCCVSKTQGCTFCNEVRTRALREMVCDKVSRRVQKNLKGKMVNSEMWDVEATYYEGLPEEWLKRAIQLQQQLKNRH